MILKGPLNLKRTSNEPQTGPKPRVGVGITQQEHVEWAVKSATDSQ